MVDCTLDKKLDKKIKGLREARRKVEGGRCSQERTVGAGGEGVCVKEAARRILRLEKNTLDFLEATCAQHHSRKTSDFLVILETN